MPKMYLLFIIPITLGIGFIIGYLIPRSSDLPAIKTVDYQKNAEDLCIKKGGFPIYSYWNGSLRDCKIIK